MNNCKSVNNVTLINTSFQYTLQPQKQNEEAAPRVVNSVLQSATFKPGLLAKQSDPPHNTNHSIFCVLPYPIAPKVLPT